MSTKRATCWSRGGKNLKKHVDGRPINHHKSMTFCANSGVVDLVGLYSCFSFPE